ncbi:MAG: hypothetical protein K0R24_2400, partial [Gammaproteobacteria bacterium]|nr:hypothetical protein [Gammaproteobacteria bacterium]
LESVGVFVAKLTVLKVKIAQAIKYLGNLLAIKVSYKSALKICILPEYQHYHHPFNANLTTKFLYDLHNLHN